MGKMLAQLAAGRFRKKPLIEQLEARILYSGDAAALFNAANFMPESSNVMVLDDDLDPTEDSAQQTAPSQHEIVFVDTRVSNYQALIDDIQNQASDDKQIDIVLLDSRQDGLAQIENTLANNSDISAIHLIAEGTVAQLHLGSNFVNAEALTSSQTALFARIGERLNDNADILIYGCNFGEGAAGETAVATLANLTGADVAASSDRTGHISEFGDWVLEVNYGVVSTDVVVSSYGQANWFGSLATFTVTNTNDSGAGSFRQAIANANGSLGTDNIFFNITGTGIHTISLVTGLPVIFDTVNIDATTDDSFAANGNRPAIVLNGGGTIQDGLLLYAGSSGSSVRALVIQNFVQDGIDISDSNGNTIVGNWIGLNTAGTAAAGNGNGVNIWESSNNIIGGTTAANRNIISGNVNGVFVGSDTGNNSTNNVILGNYIGTNVTGTSAISNQNGIILESNNSAFTSNNIIGGNAVGAGNLISGNTFYGVLIDGARANSNIIQGNIIGLNATATAVIGTGTEGIQIVNGADNTVIGGTVAGEGNQIGGATNHGIQIAGTSTGTKIQGNSIGTNATGLLNAGNGWQGIEIISGADNTLIGGITAAAANIIAFNGLNGVQVSSVGSNNNNAIIGNSIYGNSFLGIDLQVGNDAGSVAANDNLDVDGGANGLQNFPVLTSAAVTTAGTTISGNFNSNANTTYRIDFYASRPALADGTGYGEGNIHLGSITVTTNGVGDASFSPLLTRWVNNGDRVTATATVDLGGGNYGSTSEFALNVTATAASNIIVVDTTSDVNDGITTSITNLTNNRGADGFVSLREAILAANATLGTDYIFFNNGAPLVNGEHVINLAANLPDIQGTVILNASTEPEFGINNKPVVVLDGNGLASTGLKLGTGSSNSTVRGFVIRDFSANGIYVESLSNSNTIAGNYIGNLNAQGGYAGVSKGNTVSGIIVNSSSNVIGGTNAADRNVISGNEDNGILLSAGASLNSVIGNYIGTDATGLVDLGNGDDGIQIDNSNNNTIGGTTVQHRNIISGNNDDGVQLNNNSQFNILQGNYIGLGADGVTAIGNTTNGVQINNGASNNQIGGLNLADSNNIFYNGLNGIEISDFGTVSVGNSFLGNKISANAGLGINLAPGGINLNDNLDADTGVNNLQNYPLLYTANVSGGGLSIFGELRSAANTTYRLEFFRSPLGTEDPSGHGEGKDYLAFLNVTTDATGFASINIINTANIWGVIATDRISATATEIDAGNYRSTSEFSMNVPVTANVPPVHTVPGAQSVNEDTALSIGGLSVNDADSNLATTQLSVNNGTLLVNLAGGATISAGKNGSTTLTLAGTQTQINAAIATLTYQGFANYNGSDLLTVLSTDASSATDSDTVAINVNPVNDAPSFGIGNGITTTDFSLGGAYGYSVITQPDGKVLVAGYTGSDFALARYNANGSLDNSFGGGDGKVTTDFGSSNSDIGSTVLLQSDGKIVVAGYSFVSASNRTEFSVARYNSDGSLDSSFSGDGKATANVGTNDALLRAAAIQADGKIVLAGSAQNGTNWDFAVVRFNTDGTLDTSFSGDGKQMTEIGAFDDFANAVAIQANGKIVLAGRSDGATTDFAVVRYNTDGSLDTSFSGDGILTTDIAGNYDLINSVAIQADGKIVVAGFADVGGSTDFALARYNSNGSLDTTFSGDGKVTFNISAGSDYAESVAIQADGKIVVSGGLDLGAGVYNFGVARLNTDGSFDTTFSGDGKLSTAIGTSVDYAEGLTVQADGKILVAGSTNNGGNYNFALVRYNTDGSLDTSFNLVTTLDGNPTYVENNLPVVLDANVQITDAELDALNGGLGDYNGASLTIVRNGGANSDDRYSFYLGNGITFSSNNLIKAGQVIATFDTTTTSGQLVITFTNANGAIPTSADVDNIARQIGYSSFSDNLPASIQLNWTFSDGNTGSQGSGGALQAIGSTTVNITAVNDAPVNTVPSAQTTNENTSRVFSVANGNAISIIDVDAGGTNNEVRLNVTHGTLTLGSVVGLTSNSFSSNGSITTITIRGSAAAINNALNGLIYTPTPNYNGADTLTITTKDSVLLNLDLSTSQLGHYTFENTGALGTDTSFAAGNTGTNNGATALVDGTRGNVISLDGNDNIQITGIFGAPANVTLAAWVNLSAADTLGSEVITIGGRVGLRIDETTAGRGLGAFYHDGTSFVQLGSGIYLSGTGWHHVAFTFDDTNNLQQVYLDGAVVASSASTAAVAYAGSNSWIGKHNSLPDYDFTGMIDEARIYNSALTTAQIATLANDIALKDIDTVAITVNAVNDAPVIANTSTLNYTENAAGTAINTVITVTDVDNLTLSNASISITGGFVTGQDVLAFTNVAMGNIAGNYNTLTGVMSLTSAGNTATTAEWQAALRAVTYSNSSDAPNTAARTVSYAVNDGAANSNTITSTINITAVNDAPTNGGPGPQVVNEDSALAFNTIFANDVDGNLNTTQISVTSGVLNVSLVGGATISTGANNSNTFTLSGTQIQINTALQTLTFQGNLNFNGAVTLTVLSTDTLGATDSDTVSITVNSVNDAPSGSLAGFNLLEDTIYTFNQADFGFSDVDGNNFNQVYITTVPLVGELRLNGINVAAGDFITVAQINAGLLTYTPPLNVTGVNTGSHGFTFQVMDDGGTANGGSNIDASPNQFYWDLNAVNDAPVFTGLDGNPTYFEQGTAVILDSNVTIFDVELNAANNYNGASITFGRNGGNNSDDLFFKTEDGGANFTSLTASDPFTIGGITIGTVTGSGGGQLTITFNSNATQARVNLALQSIAYWNYSDTPPVTVQIDWSFFDNNVGAQGSGGTLIATGSTTVNITPDNDAPDITTTVGSLNYNENAGAVILDASVSIYDGDSTNLTGATIQITANYVNGQDVLAFTNQNGITGTWDSATGTLTLVGTATVANYQTALRSITYTNTSENPSTAVRTVEFYATDDTAETNFVASMRQIQVVNLNDAPVNTVPGAQIVNEDTVLAITGISVNDVDGDIATTQLSTGNGVLNVNLAGGATISVGANNSSTLTLAGTQTQINAALATLTYQGNFNFNGITALSITTTDINAASDSDIVIITVRAVNDAPVNLMPPTQTVAENAVLTLSSANSNNIAINDSDFGPVLRVTLTATNGLLTLAGTTGLTFFSGDGTNDVSFTFEGANTDIFAALNGMTYTPTTSFNGSATITIVTDDLGNIGSGGAQTDTDVLNITVTPVNDAPINTVPAAQSVNEDTLLSFTGINTISVNDVDGNINATQLTVTNGVLNLSLAGGATIVTGANNSSTLTLFGNQTQINAALATLTYQGNLNFNGGDTLSILTTDTNAASDSDTVAITVITVNDAPIVSLSTVPLEFTEQSPIGIDTSLTITDVDSANLTSATISISTNFSSGDILNFTNMLGITGTWDGFGALTLTGTASVADYQTALRSITFNNSSDNPITAQRVLSVVVFDGTNIGTATRAINITPVNDEQILANNLGLTVAEGATNAVIDSTRLLTTDIDNTNTQLVYTLSSIPVNGLLQLNGITLAISDTFSQADINAGLLTYSHNGNESTSDNFAFSVDDGAGSNNTGTFTITVTAVNDAPTVSYTGSATMNEDTSILFSVAGGNAIVLSDSDAGTALLQLTLNASTGIIGLQSVVGITFISGLNATASMTIQGTLANLNNAINGLSFTPSANFNGAATVSIAIDDLGNTGSGGALSNSIVIPVTVNAVNDEQVVAINTGLTVLENSTGNVINAANLLTTDVDTTNASLVYTITFTTFNGTLRLNGVGIGLGQTFTQADINAGLLTYDHNGTETTADNFAFSVDDGAGTTSTGTFNVTVTPVNDNAPIIAGGATINISVNENLTAVTTISATDADLPTQTITYTINGGADAGLFSINPTTGALQFITAPNFEAPTDVGTNNVYNVTVQASDGTFSGNKNVVVTVLNANEAPVNTGVVTLSAIAEDTPRLITQAQLLANASDVDGPTLTAINLVIASGGGTLTPSGPNWTYTPAPNYSGPVTFSYQITDGTLFTSVPGTASLSVNPVNDPPTTSAVTLTPIVEDSGVRLITRAQLLANAADVDTPLASLNVTGLNSSSGTLANNGDGTWNYTPNSNDDTAVSFSYSITDGASTVAGTANLDITPDNDRPTTSTVTLTPIAEDSGVRLITRAQLLANAADIDTPLASLTVTGLAISSGSGILADNGNDTWNYTPALNDDTAVSFSYTISDGSLTVAGTANLDITPDNDRPTTSTVTLTPIVEDSGVRLITEADLLANAADIDTPLASLTVTGLTISSGSGTLFNNGNGTWNYTPALNDDTAVSFSYTISDGSLTVAGTANLDITPDNDAPTNSGNITLSTILENSGGQVITLAQLLTNASDIDSPTLNATNFMITVGGGSIANNGNGTWTYIPAINYNGPVAFTYDITDGFLAVSNTANFTILPANANLVILAPIAEDSGIRLITQTELISSSITSTYGAGLVASGLMVTAGNGTLDDNGDGTWNYTPASNDDNEVFFGYTITLLDASTVNGLAELDITPVNDEQIIATNSILTVVEGATNAVINATRLLTTDVDNTNLQLVYTVTSIPANGVLKLNGIVMAISNTFTQADINAGLLTYSHDSSETTADAFGFSVNDGQGTSSTATFNIIVTPFNDEPTNSGTIDLTTIVEDTVRTITSSELLANASDVDNAILLITNLIITSGGGDLRNNGDGTWTYTPVPDYTGPVNFSYSVSDGSSSVAGSAILNVTPFNDAPTTSAVTFTPLNEDTRRTITAAELLINAADADGDVLTVTNLTASSGTLADNGNGTWNYTPNLNDNAPVSFSYTISDGNLTVAGSANLGMSPTNDAPTSANVFLGTILTGSSPQTITLATLLGNAYDVEGDPLTISQVTLNTGSGRLVDNTDGTWTFTPDRDYAGQVFFTYTITDSGGLTAVGGASFDVFRPIVIDDPDDEDEDEDPPPDDKDPPKEPPKVIEQIRLPSIPIKELPKINLLEGLKAVNFNFVSTTTTAFSTATSIEVRRLIDSTTSIEKFSITNFNRQDTVDTNDFQFSVTNVNEVDVESVFTYEDSYKLGLVVSAGAVAWAAVSSGFLASLLAAFPAWRHLDPIPILGKDDDDDEDADWDLIDDIE